MPNFLIAYYGVYKPASTVAGIAQTQKWKAWVESLGDAVINPGTPLQASKIVTSDGVTEDNNHNAMSGFVVIKAANMDAAVEIARSDPFLETGGKIRVSQMMEMP
jgi:hypothetical protein